MWSPSVTAVHELEDEVPVAVRFLQTVNASDVRVVERGQHLRLALESRDALGIEGHRIAGAP